MDSPREGGSFPLNTPKKVEMLKLFKEGSSSRSPSESDEQREVAPVTSRSKDLFFQNFGHSGAQNYAPQGSKWLETFKSEAVAARAYDSATIALNRGECDSNFPITEIAAHEDFHKHFTTEAIINMIADGSYNSRLIEFIHRNHTSNPNGSGSAAPTMIDHGTPFKKMFQKELTPSDVGKLNRLVIPKKHAHYFPSITPDDTKGHVLKFRDRQNRLFEFRYCYWKSSQSYVFTRGWNRFVKEMNLHEKDIVAFYDDIKTEGSNRKSFYMIDVIRVVERSGGVEAENNPVEDALEIDNPNVYDEEEVKSKNKLDKDECGFDGVERSGNAEAENNPMKDALEIDNPNVYEEEEPKSENKMDKDEGVERSGRMEAENNPMEDAQEIDNPNVYEEELKSENKMDKDECGVDGVERSGLVKAENNPMEDAQEIDYPNVYEEEELKSKNKMDKDESEGTNKAKIFGVWISEQTK